MRTHPIWPLTAALSLLACAEQPLEPMPGTYVPAQPISRRELRAAIQTQNSEEVLAVMRHRAVDCHYDRRPELCIGPWLSEACEAGETICQGACRGVAHTGISFRECE